MPRAGIPHTNRPTPALTRRGWRCRSSPLANLELGRTCGARRGSCDRPPIYGGARGSSGGRGGRRPGLDRCGSSALYLGERGMPGGWGRRTPGPRLAIQLERLSRNNYSEHYAKVVEASGGRFCAFALLCAHLAGCESVLAGLALCSASVTTRCVGIGAEKVSGASRRVPSSQLI
jgi:hypothetical protein